MSTAERTKSPDGVAERQAPQQSNLDKAIDESLRRQTLSWTVAETGEELSLSITHVRKLFANPTKSGKLPSDRDCWLFLQLCRARGLNPYVGDAFLVGYDEGDTAKFSLITAHQALLKRADATGKKTGMESGVIVVDKTSGEDRELHGDFYLEDKQTLVGGWAKVYRSDWEHPAYERVALRTFNKGYSRWKADPAGMIVKCAEASAHRLAFPREAGGLYVREEIDTMAPGDEAPAVDSPPAVPKSQRLAEDMKSRRSKRQDPPMDEPARDSKLPPEAASPKPPVNEDAEPAPDNGPHGGKDVDPVMSGWMDLIDVEDSIPGLGRVRKKISESDLIDSAKSFLYRKIDARVAAMKKP